MVLVFYYKGMLEKIMIQATLSFFFVTKRTHAVTCSTCEVSQKSALECGMAFLEIHLFLENHSLEFREIWRGNTLEKKKLELLKRIEL